MILWALVALLALLVPGSVYLGLRVASWSTEATRAEAWENGCQHGLRLAHGAVLNYRKPWITMGEERGWDLARAQFTDTLAGLLAEQVEHDVRAA